MMSCTFSKTKKPALSIGIQGRFSDTMLQVHCLVKSGSMGLELTLIIQEKIFMLEDTIMTDQPDKDIQSLNIYASKILFLHCPHNLLFPIQPSEH